MTTRPLVPVLTALLLASAASCKPDRSKPRVGAVDAAVATSPAPAPATPPAAHDAGAAPAPRGQSPSDAGQPAPSDDDEDKAEPAEPPSDEGDGKAAAADDEDRPENLKVLPKTMTSDQVTEYMSKQVGRGLGVKCRFCHEGGDFAADGNPHKKKARAMIRMTADLNQRFFGGKRGITCFTCHKGHEEPGKK